MRLRRPNFVSSRQIRLEIKPKILLRVFQWNQIPMNSHPSLREVTPRFQGTFGVTDEGRATNGPARDTRDTRRETREESQMRRGSKEGGVRAKGSQSFQSPLVCREPGQDTTWTSVRNRPPRPTPCLRLGSPADHGDGSGPSSDLIRLDPRPMSDDCPPWVGHRTEPRTICVHTTSHRKVIVCPTTILS